MGQVEISAYVSFPGIYPQLSGVKPPQQAALMEKAILNHEQSVTSDVERVTQEIINQELNIPRWQVITSKAVSIIACIGTVGAFTLAFAPHITLDFVYNSHNKC